MKRILFLLTVSLTSMVMRAQTADEVVAKHLTALGGAEKLNAVTTIVMEGATQVQGYDIALVSTQKCGVGMRMDIAVMGMSGYEITTKDKAWKMMPWEGSTDVVEKDAAEVKEAQDMLQCGGKLLNYSVNKAGTVKLSGEETIDKVVCHKLVLTVDGKDYTYFIDKSTGMIIKSIKPGKDGAEVSSSFSDYKKVGDLMFAHLITSGDRTMTWNKITLNGTVEDSKFKPE